MVNFFERVAVLQREGHAFALATVVGRRAPQTSPAAAASEVDPVCGMQVDAAARHTAEVDGVRYYFYCANCRARFVKQPHDHRRTNV